MTDEIPPAPSPLYHHFPSGACHTVESFAAEVHAILDAYRDENDNVKPDAVEALYGLARTAEDKRYLNGHFDTLGKILVDAIGEALPSRLEVDAANVHLFKQGEALARAILHVPGRQPAFHVGLYRARRFEARRRSGGEWSPGMG